MKGIFILALPRLALPRHAGPCPAAPRLAVPCAALPCPAPPFRASPCPALPRLAPQWFAYSERPATNLKNSSACASEEHHRS
jgi:hypothetical protein